MTTSLLLKSSSPALVRSSVRRLRSVLLNLTRTNGGRKHLHRTQKERNQRIQKPPHYPGCQDLTLTRMLAAPEASWPEEAAILTPPSDGDEIRQPDPCSVPSRQPAFPARSQCNPGIRVSGIPPSVCFSQSLIMTKQVQQSFFPFGSVLGMFVEI